MINILLKTLQIDYAYSINSFMYVLQKLPVFNDLITKDLYSSKQIKSIVGFFGIILSAFRAFFLKFIYFFAIISVSILISSEENFLITFFHIYFILTILGTFINNKLLNTSKKKYFSLIIFNVDATKFFRALLFWEQFTNLLLNTICTLIFMLFIKENFFKYGLILIILPFSARLIGETLNIKFYKKNNYIWYSNSNLYFPIVVGLFLSAFLPKINIFIPINIIAIISILFLILSIPCLIYLLKIKDYKLMYKQLSLVTNVMDSKNDKDYLRQAMVNVKEKDKKIDEKILKGKHGYDFFNTIFFERHKEILLRSAKKYSFVLAIIYSVLSCIVFFNTSYKDTVTLVLFKKISIYILIMFIVNRGAIITQAMFFNCDHAMLNYNFYREEQTILSLFKKRLLTVTKVNLLPALIIGFGNIFLLISSNNFNFIVMISQFIFVMSLSVLFSVHYLVIYYLLQPFNKNLEVKKASYSFVTLITYVLTYELTGIIIPTTYLALLTVIATIVYVIVSMNLVKKYAPKTFKLN